MLKILIVDDEKDITDCIVMYLESIGFNVRGAKNSQQAFLALEEYNPNILILDINLREQYNGIDVLKRALELNPNAQAAMVTGLEDDKVKKEALDCGAKMVIDKPLIISKIKDIVDNLAKNLQP